MNWLTLFIPAVICLLLVVLGCGSAFLAVVFLRKARRMPRAGGRENAPPLLTESKQSKTAASHRSFWAKSCAAFALILLLAGLCGLWATGFSISWLAKSSSGWSDSQAPELESQIRTHCVPFINQGKSIGMAVAVVTPGKAVVMSFGRRSLFRGPPVGPDTLFEIGSITKTFTGLTLAREIERGTVQLDQPVQELLPPGVDLPEAARTITLRHLTTHSSGFPRMPASYSPAQGLPMLLFGSDPYASYTPERLMEDVSKVELEFEPGSKSSYSNFGMMFLGDLLALKTRCRYEELVKRDVCQPLGMEDTTMNLLPDQARRFAQGYRAVLRCGPLLLGLRSSPWFEGNELGGAGALRSTGADMLKYLRSNMHPEGQTLEHALRESHEELARENEQVAYGMNWVRIQNQTLKQTVIWHNGGTGGFRSFIGFTEDGRVGVTILSNTTESVDDLAMALLRDLAKATDKGHGSAKGA